MTEWDSPVLIPQMRAFLVDQVVPSLSLSHTLPLFFCPCSCVVLPTQVSPNPSPQPCCATDPQPSDNGARLTLPWPNGDESEPCFQRGHPTETGVTLVKYGREAEKMHLRKGVTLSFPPLRPCGFCARAVAVCTIRTWPMRGSNLLGRWEWGQGSSF